MKLSSLSLIVAKYAIKQMYSYSSTFPTDVHTFGQGGWEWPISPPFFMMPKRTLGEHLAFYREMAVYVLVPPDGP